VVTILGVLCIAGLVVWCLKRRPRASTESKRKNQKRHGKFVNLEDFDLAAIEQAETSGEDSDERRKLREQSKIAEQQIATNSDIPRSIVLPPNESTIQTPSKERSPDSPPSSTKVQILPSPGSSISGTPGTPPEGNGKTLDQPSVARKKLIGVLDGSDGRRVERSEDDYEGENEPSPTSKTELGKQKR